VEASFVLDFSFFCIKTKEKNKNKNTRFLYSVEMTVSESILQNINRTVISTNGRNLKASLFLKIFFFDSILSIRVCYIQKLNDVT